VRSVQEPKNLKDSAVVSVKLDLFVIRKIESLIRKGYFKSKSDFIRQAILLKLVKDGYLPRNMIFFETELSGGA